MSVAGLIAVLLVAALMAAAVGAWRRARLWRRGRPAPVDCWRGLMALPQRYLGAVHDVVARDAAAARMHVPTAGGLLAGLALLLVGVAGGGRVFLMLAAAAFAVLLLGAARVARRRRDAPAHLSRGAFQRLPVSLAALALGGGVAAATVTLPLPLALLVLLLFCWGLADVIVAAPRGGPLKHAFAGALHLAFHPRPGRFSAAGRSTALMPLDLDATRLGVERPVDFTWNRLLGFDACVECGRCERACPARAAGQPLNPKKLIQDLVVGLAGPGDDSGYSGSPHPGLPVGQQRGAPGAAIVPNLIQPATLWACTTCRACVEECPMFIEHVDAIVDLRRHLTLERGELPGKAPAILEELRIADNPGGHPPAARHEWAVDLALPVLAAVGATDVLLWLGDGAFDRRVQRSLRAFVTVLRAGDVEFAILGDEELDCGDLARRLGDEATFVALARRNIATLSRYGFSRIVTADPHALHCLRNEYPAFGARYEVVHHSALLAELMRGRRLPLRGAVGRPVTYHDPCYLGRYNGEFDAPRAVLRDLGVDLREMERAGRRARCCGGGGGAPVTDVPGARRIPDMRMDDARATQAEVVAVACPQCTIMLEGVVGPRPEVRDLAELVAAALGPT